MRKQDVPNNSEPNLRISDFSNLVYNDNFTITIREAARITTPGKPFSSKKSE